MKAAPALPLQQHPAFARALRRLGRKVVAARVPQAAPVQSVQVFGQALASRGPIWHANVTDAAKASGLRQSGLRLVNAEHPDGAAFHAAGFRQLLTGASIAELDLTGPRLPAMKPKWRNRWRRAQDLPLQVSQEAFDPRHHQWLLQADLAHQKAKRFRSLPHALILALAADDPANVMVFTALKSGDPKAAMLFIRHHPVVTYHLGWRSSDAHDSSLHHRLLMEAAKVFADEGCHRLDLGIVDTVENPGLARFKIGSGAQVRALGGSWLHMGPAI